MSPYYISICNLHYHGFKRRQKLANYYDYYLPISGSKQKV